jgi:2-polyprenyl-3-methyl-5-hydroxy-6-metoxy-1,4-benzoquinol methylase
MDHRVHYSHCPVCKSSEINPLLTVKDFTVSGEEFVVWQCTPCTLRFTQNVPDVQTIGKYYKAEDYISHTNTSKGLVNQLYLKVRKFTLEQKAQLIIDETSQKTGALLDVGAGTGAFLKTAQQKGWNVTGLEPDESARILASSLHQIELKNSDELFDLPASSFDAITMEHVHDLHEYIKQLRTLLKPKGRLFIAVPNYQASEANAFGPFWAAYDVPRHLYHFTPKSIEVLIKQHGLSLHSKKPMWFDSFYISMLSNKYHSGNTKLFHSFFTGLVSNIKAAINNDRCSSLIYIIGKD